MAEQPRSKYPPIDTLKWKEKADIINTIIDSIVWFSPFFNHVLGQVEPPTQYRFEGIPYYADGVNWNPAGDGTKGFFRWDADTTAWVFVG